MYCFWENYVVRTDLQQLFPLFGSSFTHIIAWKERFILSLSFIWNIHRFCFLFFLNDVFCMQFASSLLKISRLLSWIPSASASG